MKDCSVPTLDPYKGDRVPVTYTKFPKTKAEKREFYARNCDTLADVLERVPDERHNQASWVNIMEEMGKPKTICGTTACAMGWAAVSHAIPGLQYEFESERSWETGRVVDKYADIYPKVNGKKIRDFTRVGRKFFGNAVVDDVFLNTGASKRKTIRSLRTWAKKYRDGFSEEL